MELHANKPPSLRFKSDVTTPPPPPPHCFPLHNFSPCFARLLFFLTFSRLNGSRSSCQLDFCSFWLICGGWPRPGWAVCPSVSRLSCLSAGWLSWFVFSLLRFCVFCFFSPPSMHGLFASLTKKHKSCSGEEITSKFSSPF